MSPSSAQWDEMLRQAQVRLREWNPQLADAVDAEERGKRRLTEQERAALDAFLTGTGYVVSGRRVDPASVVVFRGPETPERGRSDA